jgi:hypothetical protein
LPAHHDRRNAGDQQQCAAENDDAEYPFPIGGAIRCRVLIVLPPAESRYRSFKMLTGRKPQQISATFGTQIGRTNCCEPFPKTWKAAVARHGRSPMQPARIARAPKISFRHHLRLLTSSQQQTKKELGLFFPARVTESARTALSQFCVTHRMR